MLSILLLILKIILWIVLGIVGVLLTIICSILFIPMRYEAIGKKDDEVVLNGMLSWLFKAVRIDFVYNKEPGYRLKILFKTVKDTRESEDPKKQKKSKPSKGAKTTPKDRKHKPVKRVAKDQPKEMTKEVPKLVKKEIKKEEKTEIKKEILKAVTKEDTKEVSKEIQKSIVKETPKREAVKESTVSGAAPKETSEPKKVEKKVLKKGKKVKSEKKTDESIFDQIKKFFSILRDEQYKGVARFVFVNIWAIIRTASPRKLRVKLEFGTDDPATTGYLLGAASMFYAVIGESLVLTPNFDEEVLKGDFHLKGRIFTFKIGYYSIRILLDKRVRKIMKEI